MLTGTTIFFAKHNLLSFKFSMKVWERAMLVNTPFCKFTKFINHEYLLSSQRKKQIFMID